MNGFYIILQLLMAIPIQMCCGQQLQNGDVRLASGPDGPLEIFMDDRWFPVCCTDFNDDAATTVCRQMNLGTHGKSQPSAEKSTQAASYNITCPALKDYKNYGPTHVLRCQVEKIDCDCKTDVVCNEGAQVHYNGEVILDDDERDEAYSEGILLLYYNNQKLPVCCDLTFNKAAADSACRQLGYTGTRSSPIQSSHGTSWVIFSTCTESYSCLKSCINFTAIKIDQCDSCKLTCTYDTSYDRIYTSGSQSECMINMDTFWNGLNTVFASILFGFIAFSALTIIISIVIICYCKWKRRHNDEYEEPLNDDDR